MKRFKGLIVGVLVGLILSAGGVFAAKGVMTYMRDTAAGAGQSVVFDFLGSANATANATGTTTGFPLIIGTNATARSRTTGNASSVGFDGVTFFGITTFGGSGVGTNNGAQVTRYYYMNSTAGSAVWSTTTPEALNATNYGPFNRFF